jgi:hypothetical protein
MPSLAQNDPEPEARRGGPSLLLVVAIVVVVLVVVVLHLTGVVGPGSG